MVLDIDTTFSALYTHAIRYYIHVFNRAAWLVNLHDCVSDIQYNSTGSSTAWQSWLVFRLVVMMKVVGTYFEVVC